MTSGELLYRVKIKIESEKERILTSFGWQPEPASKIDHKKGLLPNDRGWIDEWKSIFKPDIKKINRMLDNEIEFFGETPVNFGVPVNWHKDLVSNITAPNIFGKSIDYRDDGLVGDIKLVWELARHQHLVPLTLAYVTTSDEKYKKAVVDQIEDWIEKNPFPVGIHWCSSLELALRMISWSVVHSILVSYEGNAGLFSAVKNKNKLQQCIYQHVYFISGYLSKYSSANNHLIGELTGMWVTCQVFDLGEKGEGWEIYSRESLVKQFALQVHDDGVNKEQAIYYHYYVLEYALFCYVVSKRMNNNLHDKITDSIINMAWFIKDICNKDYLPPQIGDADNGVVVRAEAESVLHPYKDILDTVDKIFNTSFVEENYTCKKSFLYNAICGKNKLNYNTDNIKSRNDSEPVIYPDGGYAILNSDRIKLVFDAGDLGYQSIAAHGHADALSFSLAIDDVWSLVDPGTFSYHKLHDWREYFKSTRAHNTLELDGKNQSTYGGSFLWLNHCKAKITDFGVSDNLVHVSGIHYGYRDLGINHERKITLDRKTNKVTIEDSLSGNGIHQVRLDYHFAPFLAVKEEKSNKIFTVYNSMDNKTFNISADNQLNWGLYKGSIDPVAGWYSDSLGKKEACYTLEGVGSVTLPVKLMVVINI